MSDKSQKIRDLNDRFRTTLAGAKILVSRSISDSPSGEALRVFESVRRFDCFHDGNDPYGEHDFGTFRDEVLGQVNWKIDCYDLAMEYGSPDPSDPAVTMRVLTIGLVSDW